MILRRLIVSLLVVASVMYGILGFRELAPASGGDQPGELGAPVISPRRVPELVAVNLADAELRNSIARILQQAGATSCVDVERGAVQVASTRQDLALIPASTTKLFTAATALQALGADHTFETRVAASDVDDGVVSGPVYLVGGGDPLLVTDDYLGSLGQRGVYTRLEVLADRVVEEGIREIRGGVSADDRRFDGQRSIATWDPGYLRQAQVGPIGALTVNQGIELLPERTAVGDPAVHGATVFTDLLRARGVSVSAGPGVGSEPDGTTDIAEVESRPVRDIVAHMLTESDNLTAEVLLKAVGREKSDSGSTNAGIEVMKEVLDIGGVSLVDGSGLDRTDRVTCGALTELLAGDDGETLKTGLPKAGETGTLRDRMDASPAVGRVQAKTGTLNNVSSLAGYVTPSNGEEMRFSIIVNGLDSTTAERLSDTLAVALSSLPPLGSLVAYAPDGIEN